MMCWWLFSLAWRKGSYFTAIKNLAVSVSQNPKVHQKNPNKTCQWCKPPEESASFREGESSCEAKQYFMGKLLKIMHWGTVRSSIVRISWKICITLKSRVNQSEAWGMSENKFGGEQPFQVLLWVIFADRIPGYNLLGRSEGQRFLLVLDVLVLALVATSLGRSFPRGLWAKPRAVTRPWRVCSPAPSLIILS